MGNQLEINSVGEIEDRNNAVSFFAQPAMISRWYKVPFRVFHRCTAVS